MMVHERFKVIGDINTIFKYIYNTYPEAKNLFPENKEGWEIYDKLMKWHSNIVKP